MRPGSSPVIVFPGAGDKALDLSIFAAPDDAICFQTVGYPGWQRLANRGFSVDVLVSELVSQIATIVPQGPIHILGFSLGGHFGYAAALALQARGREIASFCAIDSFIIHPSVQRSPMRRGYRMVAHDLSLLCERRFSDLSRSVRSRLYRAMIRCAGDRLPTLLLSLATARRLPAILRYDRLFAEEVRMELLIRLGHPWARSLDIDPITLKAPAILFRTPESARDDEAWRRRCPGLEIFEIPGDHRTISEFFENSRNLKTIFASKITGAIRERFLNAMRCPLR